MSHISQFPSRILTKHVINFCEQFILLRCKFRKIEIIIKRNSLRPIVFILVINRFNHRAMKPRYNFIIKKRSIRYS